MARKGNNKRYFLILLIATILFLLLRLKVHQTSLETDTGLYAYGAQELLRGYLPYRHYHLNKPPGIVIIYTLFFLLLGQTTLAVKWSATLAFLLSAFLIYRITRRYFPVTYSIIAYALFLLSVSAPGLQGVHANTEVFVNVFTLGCIYQTVRERKFNKRNWLLAGIFLGFGAIVKQVALFLTPAVLVWLEPWRQREGRNKAIYFLTGLMACLMIFVLVMLCLGVWNDFIFSNFVFNRAYLESKGFMERILSFPPLIFRENPLLWILGLWLPVNFLLKTGEKDSFRKLVYYSVLFTLGGIQILGQAWAHYYLQLVPFLVLSVIVFFSRNISPKRTGICFIIVILFPLLSVSRLAFLWPAEEVVSHVNSDSRGDWYDQNKQLAEYINKRVHPGEYLYNLGREGQVYFLTQTRSPSRFPHDRSYYDFPEAIEEVCRDLALRRPRVIVNTLRPPYFSERLASVLWERISRCGSLRVIEKEEYLYAELWWLETEGEI